MSTTEDDLRAALALLEQRAPQVSTRESLSSRKRRAGTSRWATPVAAIPTVFVVLGVVLAALLLTRRSNPSAAPRPIPTAASTANTAPTTCLQSAGFHPGADRTLVPGSPDAVTICQYPNGHTQVTNTTEVRALVQALDALPTSPISEGCHARFPGAVPAKGTYELHFHYSDGPDVVVNVLPQCRPSVNNSTSLQADRASTLAAPLARLVGASSTPRHGVPSGPSPVQIVGMPDVRITELDPHLGAGALDIVDGRGREWAFGWNSAELDPADKPGTNPTTYRHRHYIVYPNRDGGLNGVGVNASGFGMTITAVGRNDGFTDYKLFLAHVRYAQTLGDRSTWFRSAVRR